MSEMWADIYGIPFYQVSSEGRFRSVSHEVIVSSLRQRAHKKLIKGKMVNPFKCNSTGYVQIKAGGRKYSAHRLVAKAFCPGFKEGLVVNHKNGIRDDNRASNLEWTTLSENSRHGYQHNGRTPPSQGKFSGEHHSSKAVISTHMKTGEEKFYEAAMDAVREGFDSSSISRCCNGESAYHKGYYWRFGDKRRAA